MMYPCFRSSLESRLALSIKHVYVEQARTYRKSCEMKTLIGRRRKIITTQEENACDLDIETISFVVNGSVQLALIDSRISR